MKAELPNWLMVTHVAKGKQEGEWALAKARLNPYQISSYVEIFLTNYMGEEVKKMILIYCGGAAYCVDMTIEEADEMMSNVDRSMSFNEE